MTYNRLSEYIQPLGLIQTMPLAICDLAMWHLAEVSANHALNNHICTQALHSQGMHTFERQLRIYVHTYTVQMLVEHSNGIYVFSLLHITAEGMIAQPAMSSASNFIIQGDVVFIEEHLLHKKLCMRPDVAQKQHHNTGHVYHNGGQHDLTGYHRNLAWSMFLLCNTLSLLHQKHPKTLHSQ